MVEIVGRDEEIAAAHTFMAREGSNAAAALVLVGEAGIGKSTIWLACVDEALTRGVRVLSSRTAEAEQGFAHAGLSDLLDEALAEVVPALQPPRRRALEAALLRGESLDESLDRRALAVATRDALQLLAEPQPLLVAIDDVQWVDAETTAALGFALRRLAADRVLVLLARRAVGDAQPSALEHALDEQSVRRLQVGPLSAGALHRVLRDRLGRPFPRQTLLRIHEQSGGNPFFALEIARALVEGGDSLEPMRVPETLEELLRFRISSLPKPTEEALALTSVLGAPSQSLLAQAGVTRDALEPAFRARVLEREGANIRFTHPLLSAVAYQQLEDGRHAVHARAAQLVEDPLVKARHVALSTEAPDGHTAAMLDDAATLAVARGAIAVAAELAEEALRLTPPQSQEDRRRRTLEAARAELAAGEWTRARTLAVGLLAEADADSLRAEALLLLAEFEHDDLAVPVLEEALRAAPEHSALEALLHLRLAWAARFRRGFPATLEGTRTALALAEQLKDYALCFEALVQLVRVGGMVGDPETPSYAERARELAVDAGDARMLAEVSALDYGWFLDAAGHAEQRASLERLHTEWLDRDELFAAFVLWTLAWVDLWGGRWADGARHAARAQDVNLQYGVERNQDYIPIAWIAAHRGETEVALLQSERALKLCEEQIGFHPPLLQAVPGLVALWGGDPLEAVEHLGEADRQAAQLGWGAPKTRPWTADYAEALLELGRVDDATRLVDRWEADAARLGQERLAPVARCRGLIAAARGDVAPAASLLEEAATLHEDAGDAFGRARALLALGVVLRRARQKRTARDACAAALDVFEQLGAPAWVERARVELASIGGRTRTDGLTDAEARVATLAAAGRTNREVAAALFLSERTVAGHLTHVYAKLGLRSRTELARALG